MIAEYTSVAGDTVDLVCFNVYGKQEGAMEIVLEANPHILAYRGALPIDTKLVMPEIPPDSLPSSTIKLWKYLTPE